MTRPSIHGGLNRSDTIIRGLVALVVTVVLNLLIRVVATTLFDVDAGYEHLAWRDFISTTIGVVAFALLVRVVLMRYGDRGAQIFVRIAIVVFVLSLAGPLSLLSTDEAADGGVVTTLVSMHVATGLVIWASLGSSGREPVVMT